MINSSNSVVYLQVWNFI